MQRDDIIRNIRDALPSEIHGITVTIDSSEAFPDIDIFERRTNEQAVLFFMSDIISDLEALHTQYPGVYKRYVVAIESARANYIKFGKKTYK